jgi:hypothetical protein
LSEPARPALHDSRRRLPPKARGGHRAVREGKQGGHAEPEGRLRADLITYRDGKRNHLRTSKLRQMVPPIDKVVAVTTKTAHGIFATDQMCGVVGQEKPTGIMPSQSPRTPIKRHSLNFSMKDERLGCEPMPSRQDVASKRLLQLLEDARLRNLPRVVDALMGPLSEGINAVLLSNLDDRLVHATLSKVALMLDEADPDDAEILRAFKAAGLNHRNPLHWRTLLECFAKAHFGKKKTKPVKWDNYELMVVLRDYLKVKKRNRPKKMSDVEVCKFLMKDKAYKDTYSRYNLDALRRLVRRARSPKYDLHLRHPEMRDPVLQVIRDVFESRGMPWDEEWGKRIADSLAVTIEEVKHPQT